MNNRDVISDLTYRGYDGKLSAPYNRWTVVAKHGVISAVTNKAYWVLLTLAAWYYMLMMAIIFFVDRFAEEAIPDGTANPWFNTIDWSSQMMHGFTFGNLFWLIILLILGSRTIASDNKSNALLVYLSKPFSKTDYLIGKWVGLFIPMALAMLLPTLFFYLNGVLNYREYGFVSDDPYMILKLLVSIPISAAFFTSIAIGVSSLFNSARNAGATLAGIYFLSTIFNWIISAAILAVHNSREQVPAFLETLFYANMGGLPHALVRGVLGNPNPNAFNANQGDLVISAPQPLLTLAVMVIISLLAMAIARSRVKAVEVVK